LGISKKRLSFSDLSQSFGAIAFPIHIWVIINILVIFPAWLLRLSLPELAGSISYALVAALLESSILWAMMVGLGFVLPRKWLADKFVVLSSALVWLLTVWAMLGHFHFSNILQWGPEKFAAALILVVFTLMLVYWLIRRFARLEGWIQKGVQGLIVVSYVYIFFDLVGLAIVIFRNL
jgi:hypothetical protein